MSGSPTACAMKDKCLCLAANKDEPLIGELLGMRAPVIEENFDSLSDYLQIIVEPTFAEYQRHRASARLAFLTCVAIFHSIDRAAHPKPSGNLRKKWRAQSIEFWVVDMFAHRLKHVRSNDEKHVSAEPGLPASYLVDTMEFHHLYHAMRDAIKFVRQQAEILDRKRLAQSKQ
jgi:hypothetical protein